MDRFRLDEPLGLRPETRPGDGTEASPCPCIEAWLLVPGSERGPRLLMLERTEAHGGFWQGVSGVVEPDDPTMRHAIVREVEEETGQRVERVVDLGPFSCFQGVISGRWFRKRPVCAILAEDLELSDVRLSEEHGRATLADFDEARALVPWPGNAEALTRIERWLETGVDPRRD